MIEIVFFCISKLNIHTYIFIIVYSNYKLKRNRKMNWRKSNEWKKKCRQKNHIVQNTFLLNACKEEQELQSVTMDHGLLKRIRWGNAVNWFVLIQIEIETTRRKKMSSSIFHGRWNLWSPQCIRSSNWSKYINIDRVHLRLTTKTTIEQNLFGWLTASHLRTINVGKKNITITKLYNFDVAHHGGNN